MGNKKRTIQQIVNVFETGTPEGNYSLVTTMAGDSGGLTYGRSQTTLNSGNLYKMLERYVQIELADGQQQESDVLARYLQALLPKFKAKDRTLAFNQTVKDALRILGHDQDMRDTQDWFFDQAYYEPAMRKADELKLAYPLSRAVVYDSYVHGSFALVRKLFPQVPPNKGGNEREWTRCYVAARKKWLSGKSKPLCNTVYRMDAFQQLIRENNWHLNTPLVIRGKRIV